MKTVLKSAMVRVVIMTLLSSITTACTLRFPQFEGLATKWMGTAEPVAPYTWHMASGDYQQEVIAVSTDNGVVFANTADDAMLFDGEALRRVVKLGNNKNRYEIVDINQGERLLRQYLVNGARQADHVCSAWVKNAVEWLQTCHEPVASQNSYVNRLGFNAEGKLNYIDQVISADNIRVTISQ